jgi:hypothetical protein
VWILFALLGGLALALAIGAARVFLAKDAAIHNRQGEVALFGGMVKLVLWEANEGLLLLRNKRISRVIPGGRGGNP